MSPVIRVENLSKLYRIGTRGTHAGDLRHRLGSALTYPFRKLWNGVGSRAELQPFRLLDVARIHPRLSS